MGCKGVLRYIDYVIVFDKAEHRENLWEVQHYVVAAGLQVRKKCEFNVKHSTSWGTAQGLTPLEFKVEVTAKSSIP